MTDRETTHRLSQDGVLCGGEGPWVSPVDSAVTCPTCRALLTLEAMRRRVMIRRAVVLIAPMASA